MKPSQTTIKQIEQLSHKNKYMPVLANEKTVPELIS